MKTHFLGSDGYLFVKRDHPRCDPRGLVREHILIAEAAIGRYLPPLAVVHHVNEVKHDNSRGNLVICEDENYHRLIHVRTRILRAGFDPNTHAMCVMCREFKAISGFTKNRRHLSGIGTSCHRCRIEYSRLYHPLNKARLDAKERLRQDLIGRGIARHCDHGTRLILDCEPCSLMEAP